MNPFLMLLRVGEPDLPPPSPPSPPKGRTKANPLKKRARKAQKFARRRQR